MLFAKIIYTKCHLQSKLCNTILLPYDAKHLYHFARVLPKCFFMYIFENNDKMWVKFLVEVDMIILNLYLHFFLLSNISLIENMDLQNYITIEEFEVKNFVEYFFKGFKVKI